MQDAPWYSASFAAWPAQRLVSLYFLPTHHPIYLYLIFNFFLCYPNQIIFRAGQALGILSNI